MSLRNSVDVEMILGLLPSFYREYIHDKQFLEDLLQVYIEAADLLFIYSSTIGANQVLPQVELTRNIPFYLLDVPNAVYDTNDLIAKYPDWNTKTVGQKVVILDNESIYENLDVRRQWDVAPPQIQALKIDRFVSENLSKLYKEYMDYVVSDSKLYLFGGLARPLPNGATKQIILKDIQVDANKAESMWGTFAKFIQGNVYTTTEYVSILTSVLQAYLNGPTVESLQSAIKAMSGLGSDFEIQDRFSPNLPSHRRKYWDDGRLGNFDFLLTLPLSLITNTEKLGYINGAIAAMKPSYTNFFTIFTESLADLLLLTDSMTILYTYLVDRTDTIPVSEEITYSVSSSSPLVDSLAYESPYVMDSLVTFDSGIKLDARNPGIRDTFDIVIKPIV